MHSNASFCQTGDAGPSAVSTAYGNADPGTTSLSSIFRSVSLRFPVGTFVHAASSLLDGYIMQVRAGIVRWVYDDGTLIMVNFRTAGRRGKLISVWANDLNFTKGIHSLCKRLITVHKSIRLHLMCFIQRCLCLQWNHPRCSRFQSRVRPRLHRVLRIFLSQAMQDPRRFRPHKGVWF